MGVSKAYELERYFKINTSSDDTPGGDDRVGGDADA